jgi:hypothetical protein
MPVLSIEIANLDMRQSKKFPAPQEIEELRREREERQEEVRPTLRRMDAVRFVNSASAAAGLKRETQRRGSRMSAGLRRFTRKMTAPFRQLRKLSCF